MVSHDNLGARQAGKGTASRAPTISFHKSIDPGVLALTILFLCMSAAYLGFVAVAGESFDAVFSIAGVDPVGYYSYLPSLFFDRDLDLSNQFERLSGKEFAEALVGAGLSKESTTATGRVPNPFSIGPPLLWAPFYAVGHLFALMLGYAADGYSLPYRFSVFAANAFYAFVGVVLSYRWVSRLIEKRIAIFAAVSLWLGSSLLYYTYPFSPMSHPVSMAAVAGFLLAWHGTRGQWTMQRWALLGALAGLMTLCRWQNVLFCSVPALEWAFTRQKQRTKVETVRWRMITPRDLVGWMVFGACVLAVFWPQMVAWRSIYGSYLLIPQGSGFLRWAKPHLFDVLFSTRHGLITWTPIVAFCFVGLGILAGKDRALGGILSFAVILQLYLNSITEAMGWSFGMRRMLNCTPIFVLGLAVLAQRLKERQIRWLWLWLGSGALVVWNLLFILQYRMGMIPRDGYLTFDQLVTDKFTLVFAIFDLLTAKI